METELTAAVDGNDTASPLFVEGSNYPKARASRATAKHIDKGRVLVFGVAARERSMDDFGDRELDYVGRPTFFECRDQDVDLGLRDDGLDGVSGLAEQL